MAKALCPEQLDLFSDQKFYSGKVRDVYWIENKIVLLATDRISAFDHILNQAIPFKGQVLNQISAYFLEQTKDIVPNWFEESPDPNVGIGISCDPIRLEMVVRGYLVGHAWRIYKTGERMICGVRMPDGMVENQSFPKAIITPSLKADEGHDEDISKEEILSQGIVSAEEYSILEDYTLKLFDFGSKAARDKALILVDTKYEFGKYKGKILLMDEVHTPDSSRYFYAQGYEERLSKGEKQKQLSKEFVREWLIDMGFQGLDGQILPDMSAEFVEQVSERYIELYEKITGKAFVKSETNDIETRVATNIKKAFS